MAKGRQRRLLVVADLSAKKRGSLEEQFAALARALAERRIATTLVLSRPAAPAVSALFGEARIAVEVIDFARPLLAAAKVARLAHRLAPAVVHLHFVQLASPVTIAAAASGARIVMNDHLALGGKTGPRAEVKRAVCGALGRCVDRRVAVSRFVARTIAAAEAPRAEQLRVIENGVPLDRFSLGKIDRAERREARRSLDLRGPAIACIARMAHEKGVDVAIRALALMRKSGALPTLFVVGDGPRTTECERLARALGVAAAVRFVGLRDDVERVFAACEQAWVPSRAEAFGLAAAEAMAAGLPVIATRAGGLPEVVDDGRTGLLVPVDDAEALALAARQLLDDPARARAMGEAGRARAMRRFGMARYTARVIALYDELVPAWRALPVREP